MAKVQIKDRIRSFTQSEVHRLLELLDRMVVSINENPLVEFEDVKITTPAVADTEFAIGLQTLKRKPTTYYVISKDKPGDVYTSNPTGWAFNKMFLKCTGTAVTMTLRVT